MKKLSHEKFLKFVVLAFFVRAATASIKAFLPFDLPHIWRQVDTLGVSIRYWIRWTNESPAQYPLVPAVLNSMDGYAMMPMEFPLVNLMGAPFFGFGVAYGKPLAMLLLMAVNFFLTWLCYLVWKNEKIFGLKVGPAFLLIPVLGISSTFVTKFMPDYLSMILALLGVGLLWRQDASAVEIQKANKPPNTILQSIFAATLIALALLVKPTAVTVLVLLLLSDGTLVEKSKKIAWTFPPLLAAAFYYTVGLKWMAGLQDTPSLYAVEPRPPLTSVLEFFAEPRALAKLIFEDVLFIAAPLLILFALPLILSSVRKVILALGGAFVLQILAIAALDGSHSYVHSYYHIGTSPVMVLCLMFTIEGLFASSDDLRFQKLRRAVSVLLALGALSLIYQNYFFELRSLSPKRSGKFIWQQDIEALKNRNPEFPWGQGYTFRASRALAYPNLGIYFGEREGSSTAQYGFFLNEEVPAAECTVVDTSPRVSLVRCR